jgi:hypothetical protein
MKFEKPQTRVITDRKIGGNSGSSNFVREYAEVLADCDQALASMKTDKSFRAIYEKYLGP